MALKNADTVSKRPEISTDGYNPLMLIPMAGKDPSFSFQWGYPNEKRDRFIPKKLLGKRRLIGRPTPSMRILHDLFAKDLGDAIEKMGEKASYTIRHLLSATGCVEGSNPTKNVKVHESGEFFYITDLVAAYPSVDLHRLTTLLVFIFNYEHYGAEGYRVYQLARNDSLQLELNCDPLFAKMESFVKFAFGGIRGEGLAVGGPLSPYLLNLYCEVYLNSRLRYYLSKFDDKRHPERTITFTQYVDDYAFSSQSMIGEDTRRNIRRMIEEAGFQVNHRKSFVLKRSMGTVFITKLGLRARTVTFDEDLDSSGRLKPTNAGILTFPQKKRRRLHGIISSFFSQAYAPEGKVGTFWNDCPEVITGIIAEFIYYTKNVGRLTETDKKTLWLCKEFETAAARSLKKLRTARQKKTDEKTRRREARQLMK